MNSDRFEKRMQTLRRKLDEAEIEHFAAQELVRHTSQEWPFRATYPPPIRLIEHIIPTVKIADRLREDWGGPVRVVSGYRAPAYNDFVVEGSDDSQHMYFRALDLQPVNSQYADWIEHVERIVWELRDDEGQTVGLGRYDTFIHIDTGYYSHSRDWDRRS